MESSLDGVVVLIVGLILLFGGILAVFGVFLAASFDGFRVRMGVRAFLRSLQDRAYAERVRGLSGEIATPVVPPPPPPPKGEALRFLAILQRDGRLLDFLLEDIQGYPDVQIGAAVKDIHRQCQSCLKEHLVLEPILGQEEGANVEVASGFDPSAVRLTGNVTGQPPFRGVLRHHGWRVKELKLAPPPAGQDAFVLMPAEVEIP